jgi:hypothetical protein
VKEPLRIFRVDHDQLRIVHEVRNYTAIELGVLHEFSRDEKLQYIVTTSTEPDQFPIDVDTEFSKAIAMSFWENMVLRHEFAVRRILITALWTFARSVGFKITLGNLLFLWCCPQATPYRDSSKALKMSNPQKELLFSFMVFFF